MSRVQRVPTGCVTFRGVANVPAPPANTTNFAQRWTCSNERDLFETIRAEWDISPTVIGWGAYGRVRCSGTAVHLVKAVLPVPGRSPLMRLVVLRGLVRGQWLHRHSSRPCVHAAVTAGNLGWDQSARIVDARSSVDGNGATLRKWPCSAKRSGSCADPCRIRAAIAALVNTWLSFICPP